MLKEAARTIKNVVYYDDVQILVREATSNSKDIPTPAILKQIGTYMIQYDTYSTILAMLWKRLCDLEYKRHVIKALLCIDYLVRLNPPTPGVQLRLIVDIKDKFNDLDRLAKLHTMGNGISNELVIRIQRIAEQLVEFITRVESGDVVLNDDTTIQETKKHIKKKKKKKTISDTTNHNDSNQIELLPSDTLTNFLDVSATQPPSTQPSINQYGFDFLLDNNDYFSNTPHNHPHHEQQTVQYDTQPTVQQSWQCNHCSFNNRMDSLECQVCQTNRFGNHKSIESSHTVAHDIVPDTNANSKQSILASGGWACSWCSYLNNSSRETCEVCDKGRIASNFSNVVKLEYLRKQQTKQDVVNKSWVCHSCTFANKADDILCAICSTPNPHASQSAINDAQAIQAKKQEKRGDNDMMIHDIDVFSYTSNQDAPAILQRNKQSATQPANDRRSTMPAKLQQTLQSVTPTNSAGKNTLPSINENDNMVLPVQLSITQQNSHAAKQPIQFQNRTPQLQHSQSHQSSPRNTLSINISDDPFTDLANKRAVQSNNVSPHNRTGTTQPQRSGTLPAQISTVLSQQRNTNKQLFNDKLPSNKQWICTHCTYANDSVKLVCEMCNTPKVQSLMNKQSPRHALQPQPQPAVQSQQWQCATCTYINSANDKTCQMCNNTPNQRALVSVPQSQPAQSAPVHKPTTNMKNNNTDLLSMFDVSATQPSSSQQQQSRRTTAPGGPQISPNISPDTQLPLHPSQSQSTLLSQQNLPQTAYTRRSKVESQLPVSHSSNFPIQSSTAANNNSNQSTNDVVRSISLDSLIISPSQNRATPFDYISSHDNSQSTSVVPSHQNSPHKSNHTNSNIDLFADLMNQQQSLTTQPYINPVVTTTPYYTPQTQYTSIKPSHTHSYTQQQSTNQLQLPTNDELLSPTTAASRRRTLPQSMWSPVSITQSAKQQTRQLSFGEMFDQAANNFATDWVTSAVPVPSTQNNNNNISNPFDNVPTPKNNSNIHQKSKQPHNRAISSIDLFDSVPTQPQAPALPPPRKSASNKPQLATDTYNPVTYNKRSGSDEHKTTDAITNHHKPQLDLPSAIDSRGVSQFEILSPSTHIHVSDDNSSDDTRQKIIDEIISSEITYVDYLYECIANYLDPLKRQCDKLNLTSKQISSIFSNLTVLTQFHTIFLTDIKSITSNKSNISTVFLQYADFLKMYTQYLNSYEKAIATINSLRDNKKFQNFLKTKIVELNGKSLMYYLIMPVQRIPRYVLLLRELIKYTSPLHTEYQTLQHALDKLESIAAYINSSKKYVENMSKLLDIQNRISGLNGVIYMPTRRLLHEGKLRLHGSDDMLVFLFNDLYLYTNNNFDVCGKIELTDLQLIDKQQHDDSHTATDSGSNSNTIILYNKTDQSELLFQCDTINEYNEWNDYIKSALAAQHNNNSTTNKLMQKSSSTNNVINSSRDELFDNVACSISVASPKLNHTTATNSTHISDTTSISSETINNINHASPPPLPTFNKKKPSPQIYTHDLEI